MTIPVLVNNIVQRLENGVIAVVRACRGGTRTGRRRQQQSNFVSDDPTEEALVVNSPATPIDVKKFFAHYTLSTGDSRKPLKLKLSRRGLVTPYPFQY